MADSYLVYLQSSVLIKIKSPESEFGYEEQGGGGQQVCNYVDLLAKPICRDCYDNAILCGLSPGMVQILCSHQSSAYIPCAQPTYWTVHRDKNLILILADAKKMFFSFSLSSFSFFQQSSELIERRNVFHSNFFFITW